MNTTDQIIIENLVNRIEKLEKKLRTLTELRYTPATKKELRDYIDWSAQQKHKNQKQFSNGTD
jgi:hypothetical protein|tara:strand:- start:493 stop:681 length:189 start_codon:yes stop_codon:yes gene_type:complete